MPDGVSGIVFAIEEMSRSYEARTSSLVLTAVVIAGLASLGLVGNYSYFGQTSGTLEGPADWLAVAVCGLGGGALGALFSRLVLAGTAMVQRFVAPAPGVRGRCWWPWPAGWA